MCDTHHINILTSMKIPKFQRNIWKEIPKWIEKHDQNEEIMYMHTWLYNYDFYICKGILRPEITVKFFAVAIIFFNSGISLRSEVYIDTFSKSI